MGQLDRGQLRRSLDALAQLAEIRRIDEFPARAATLLRELIACDISSYTAVDPSSGRAKIAADPAETLFAGSEELFARFALQNPLVEHYTRTGDGRALCISDFITRRQLHRTDIYEHVYRPIDVEYQMAITLPSPTGQFASSREIVGLTLSRSRRDFSAGERGLLDLMRPHLGAALERLHEVALLSALGDGGSDGDAWAALIDGQGTVALTSRAAAGDLGLRPGEPLPRELRTWAREARAALCGNGARGAVRTGTVALRGREVLAQLRLAAHGGLDSLRLRPAGEPPAAAQLRALGLTRRQAEVLALVLRGESSPRIAISLELSPRTVEKHLEAVYTHLGVGGRSQAIVHVLGVISAGWLV
jgi:DNA-binding CsgD family transcriptional regulator